tara:strand:- start:94 stop:369 length:276 start_codon:yes stop_codon:yes gene_type:complete
MKKDNNVNYKNIYSIYDTVTELFEPPFIDINKGSALRRIQDLMISNPQSPYAKFPDNFQLWEIGIWNEISGFCYSEDHSLVIDLKDITTKD